MITLNPLRYHGYDWHTINKQSCHSRLNEVFVMGFVHSYRWHSIPIQSLDRSGFLFHLRSNRQNNSSIWTKSCLKVQNVKYILANVKVCMVSNVCKLSKNKKRNSWRKKMKNLLLFRLYCNFIQKFASPGLWSFDSLAYLTFIILLCLLCYGLWFMVEVQGFQMNGTNVSTIQPISMSHFAFIAIFSFFLFFFNLTGSPLNPNYLLLYHRFDT